MRIQALVLRKTRHVIPRRRRNKSEARGSYGLLHRLDAPVEPGASDPDAMFARAMAAGAREIAPVKNAHGSRLGRVVDPFGHHWEIGRPLEP